MPLVPLTYADLCHPIASRVPFTRDGWIFELKHDGFRAFARKTPTGVQLLSRWGRSMAAAFPEIVAALHEMPDATLDGELVVPDAAGRSDFEELRRRNLLQRPQMIHEASILRPAVFVAFDLLAIDGANLRGQPLRMRRELLHQYVQALGVHVIEHVEMHGEPLFRAIASQDHEGIVAKRADAPYRAGRQPAWIKIKNRNYSRREAVEWRA